MNRNRTGDLWRRVGLVLLVGLVGLMAPAAVIAQEGDDSDAPPPVKRTQRLLFEIGSWVAQPAGLEYAPVSQLDPDDVFGAELVPLRHATEGEIRWRVAYRLPERHAELSVSYYSHRTGSKGSDSRPGQFIFGERLAAPAFAGYALDGRADAWEATSETRLRDARLEYRQRLFRSDTGLELTGAIGWGRVWHTRTQSAAYYALLPDLPPLLPPLSTPRPDLAPDPDFAALSSRFEGRGLTAGLDLKVPLVGERLQLEASADLAVLRGETDASYASQTNAYGFDGDLLTPANYDLFGQSFETSPGSGVFIPFASFIDQFAFGTGQRAKTIPTTSDVQGLSLGLRWSTRDWLDVFAGFRSARYTDVGVDLLPGPASALTTEPQDFRRETRSATYEGFYVGVSIFLF